MEDGGDDSATEPLPPPPPPPADTIVSVNGDDRDNAAAAAAEVPADATADDVHAHFFPFRRLSPDWNAYEVAKTALLSVTLFPLRVFAFAVLAGAIYAAAVLAMVGVKSPADYAYRPLPRWRKVLLKGISPLVRAVAFCAFGMYRIRWTRAADHDEKALVIVANHLGYLDIVALRAVYAGSFVAKGDIARVPILGSIARAIQCLFVVEGKPLTASLLQRVDATYACHLSKRVRVTGEAQPEGAPLEECLGCGTCLNTLTIFPEGTTCNGKAMIKFRTGVFLAGKPIRPVVVKLPYKRWNTSWESVPFRYHMWRTMTQFSNSAELVELPIYVPDAEERADPRLFAERVQADMQAVLDGIPVYELSRKHKFVYHDWLRGKVDPPTALAKAEELKRGDKLLLAAVAKEGSLPVGSPV
ncbi:hypothetical protein MMPV_001401 [Pyropia vietnamensis]